MSALKGVHWCTAQAKSTGEKITNEEKARLQKYHVIEHDDESAICTQKGWSKWIRFKNKKMMQALDNYVKEMKLRVLDKKST